MVIAKEEGRRKKEEGSSATSNVRDVTDVSPSEEGRGKREERKMVRSRKLTNDTNFSCTHT
ncbi:hypothetical protein IQ269_19175 [Tychonema sp. LEGE 07199]|uniref:hypothetical protein n=1 Tax=unclassified Tychonema TaxID=2642144 RepID=UPI001880594C|nr:MULTISPECIES: hypothetical protein [unclassified Tychonema]MBE9122861.1 hypothetical protein [Tychonema sp. LEGE 07199]MBE9131666.1 hypothetical protein [Tychonema sp. LEGE 07196]